MNSKSVFTLVLLGFLALSGQGRAQEAIAIDTSLGALHAFADKMGFSCDTQDVENIKSLIKSDTDAALYYGYLADICGQQDKIPFSKFFLGVVSFNTEDYQGATELLQQAIDGGIKKPQASFHLGKAYWRLGKLELARDAFEAVIANEMSGERLKAATNAELMLVLVSIESEAANVEFEKNKKKSNGDQNASSISLVGYGNGGNVNLTKHMGKVTIVHFWASWCAPCIAEFPKLLAFYESHKKQGLKLVTLSQDHKKSLVDKFLKRYKLNLDLPVYYDQGGRLQEDLTDGVGLPTSVIFNADGKIISSEIGMTDWTASDIRSLIIEELGKNG